jgi:hypothetical protein
MSALRQADFLELLPPADRLQYSELSRRLTSYSNRCFRNRRLDQLDEAFTAIELETILHMEVVTRFLSDLNSLMCVENIALALDSFSVKK